MRLVAGVPVVLALLGIAACGEAEPGLPAPNEATQPPTQVLPEVGRPNLVGVLQLTVLKAELVLAANAGRELPSGTNLLRLDLSLRNPTANAVPAPVLTLSCAGVVAGGRLSDEAPGSLPAGPVGPQEIAIGSVLFAVPGACEQGILLARGVAEAGRPPQPVPIRVN